MRPSTIYALTFAGVTGTFIFVNSLRQTIKLFNEEVEIITKKCTELMKLHHKVKYYEKFIENKQLTEEFNDYKSNAELQEIEGTENISKHGKFNISYKNETDETEEISNHGKFTITCDY